MLRIGRSSFAGAARAPPPAEVESASAAGPADKIGDKAFVERASRAQIGWHQPNAL
jgi:hypothetical protein